MLFTVKTLDKENSGALRDELRKAHLNYLKLFESATYFDGPFLTDDGTRELGSFKILDMPDKATVEQHEADEPFITGGLQYGTTIHRYEAQVPYTFRDCPRKRGNIQFLVLAYDKSGQGDLREELDASHRAYRESIHDTCITFGALLTEAGDKPTGTLSILDAENIGAAKELWENDPFVQGGLFDSIEFYRWRFGRIFDQFGA
jgi:uncharacterized protein